MCVHMHAITALFVCISDHHGFNDKQNFLTFKLLARIQPFDCAHGRIHHTGCANHSIMFVRERRGNYQAEPSSVGVGWKVVSFRACVRFLLWSEIRLSASRRRCTSRYIRWDVNSSPRHLTSRSMANRSTESFDSNIIYFSLNRLIRRRRRRQHHADRLKGVLRYTACRRS